MAAGSFGSRSGQSVVESCLIIFLIGLIFTGLFQISQLFAAREILAHAAARAARARTVGFNRWMVTKCARVAAIPNSGRMTWPDYDPSDPHLRTMIQTLRPGDLWEAAVREVPVSTQLALEQARIPEYMASRNHAQADFILNYEDWDSVHVQAVAGGGAAPQVAATAWQNYPLRVPMHRAFYADPDDRILLHVDATLENHYPLYLDDRNW